MPVEVSEVRDRRLIILIRFEDFMSMGFALVVVLQFGIEVGVGIRSILGAQNREAQIRNLSV